MDAHRREMEMLQAEIAKQRDQWEQEKKLVALRHAFKGELFQLNVSGVTEGFLLN